MQVRGPSPCQILWAMDRPGRLIGLYSIHIRLYGRLLDDMKHRMHLICPRASLLLGPARRVLSSLLECSVYGFLLAQDTFCVFIHLRTPELTSDLDQTQRSAAGGVHRQAASVCGVLPPASREPRRRVITMY